MTTFAKVKKIYAITKTCSSKTNQTLTRISILMIHKFGGKQSLYVLILTLILPFLKVDAQNITISGVVRDSITHNPIPFASVLLLDTDRGELTNDKGKFSITTGLKPKAVRVSAMGYTTKDINVSPRKNIQLTIDLVSTGVLLNEVTAHPKKEHYSKKNNPAVDFMEKIRATQDLNDPRRMPYYNYDKYERITLAINDYHFNDSAKSGIDKKFSFLKEYVDTSDVSGKPILNVALREKSSNVYYRHEPEREREYVTGLRTSGLDEILDKQSMQTFYEDVMREVDVYDNDINILQNRFVSPLSRIAPDFYKFYLTDTVMVDTVECVELTFVPRNPSSFGFTGRFYVPKGDSTMFIKKIVLRAPHDINLNFIEDLEISQEYVKSPDGTRLKVNDDMSIEASIIPGAQGIYARRHTAYDNHNFSPTPDQSIFKRGSYQVYAPGAEYRDLSFWDQKRLIKISKGANSMEKMMERLRSVPVYYWSEKVLKILVSGYINTGNPSKFDLGPMNTTMSYNSMEGLRLRAGGMTTANLSRRWFAKGYGAYGTRDHKWKYLGELEYSFRDKNYHSREFPVHSLRATQMYDVDMLGQHYLFTNADNFVLSLKRMEDLQMTYHRVSKLEYILELENNFSVEATFKNERQEATKYMPFRNGFGRNFGHYTMNSFKLQLRYAPGEKFYQMKTMRIPINFDAPIFVLSHTIAPKGFMGNPFAVSTTEASVQKRFWFSAFGFVDIIGKGGHVWTRSPYPNLLIPNANLSYIIQPESFCCLNPMEFINDSYAQWDLTYWANGAIFNLIPYFKKLKLREAFMFRGLYGHLSDKNKPWFNDELYSFPEISETRTMSGRPYMEAGVGVDNVFKVLRVDYVWRLTYRNNPNACKGGVRIAMHFTF